MRNAYVNDMLVARLKEYDKRLRDFEAGTLRLEVR